jgi:flagellar basal body P-ring formation protein FlgA
MFKLPNMQRMINLKVGKAFGAVLFMFMALSSESGIAQTQVAGPEAGMLESTQRWVDQAVASTRAAGPTALKTEVVLGNLDSRLRLAPCNRVEPFLPAGNRLWGRTRMGLRCTDGVAKWSVFLPVTVKAIGTAWVVKGEVAVGSVLKPEDVTEAEVDWAEDNAAVVIDPALWVGQVATRTLVAGQVLRQGMFKPAQVFQVGAQVRVVAQGVGFQILSDGQALTAGVVGQSARVKMDNGRIATGVVLDTRTVKIEI